MRLALLSQRLMTRLDRTPLRPLLLSLYRLLTWVIPRVLLAGREGTAYLAGSGPSGDLVMGISDIDLVLVVEGTPGRPGAARQAVVGRWRRLKRLAPPLGWLAYVAVYERDVVEDLAGSCLTFGLEAGGDRSLYHRSGGAPPDDFGLSTRPGLYATSDDWRRLTGGGAPPGRPRDRQDQRIAAWAELQYWWAYTQRVCADPAGLWKLYLCAKMVAEPARILLWLEGGRRVRSRGEALRAAYDLVPDEAPAITSALRLLEDLPRAPAPPLAELLPAMVRLSRRVAQTLGRELDGHGTTEVRLLRAAGDDLALAPGALAGVARLCDGSPRPLPLCDWRARVVPRVPDEAFVLIPGDPGDPAVVGQAAVTGAEGAYPALLHHELLFLLTTDPWERSVLRTLQFWGSDPVSWALATGRESALFPDVAGWGAQDCARRAVAEHRAWLDARDGPDAPGLLNAARAALFLESLGRGAPTLAADAAAVAAELAVAVPEHGERVAAAFEDYRRARAVGVAPGEQATRALGAAVRCLESYSSTAGRALAGGM